IGGPTLRFQCPTVPFDFVDFLFQVLNPHIPLLHLANRIFSFTKQLFVHSFHI
ncbi:hypothetical protein C7212DRAFT_19906, partial [Tuber magnatum]